MKKNKSQIFLFDLILSLVILIVAFGLITSYFISNSSNVNLYELNQQILIGITTTKINNLNGIEIRQMFINNKIKNIENTIAQQIGEFYYLGDLEMANNLTRIYVKDSVSKQYNLRVYLRDNTNTPTLLYSKINPGSDKIEKSEVVSISERSIIGFVNATDAFGPYTFKIEVWT